MNIANWNLPVRDIHWTYRTSDELHATQAGIDFAENAADNRAEDHQSRDNDNSYQNKD